MLYILLLIICVAVELSPRINTDNNVKKIAIGFVMIGAIVEYSGKPSIFIEIGIAVYLLANLFTAYCSKPKRRAADR
jgi:hypothetical protein